MPEIDKGIPLMKPTFFDDNDPNNPKKKTFIEREAVDKIIHELWSEPSYQHEGEDFRCGVSAVESRIAEIPTADVVEVRHGEWIHHRLSNGDIWDCSECKTLGSPQWNWCPICGAKMDGEGD